MERKVNFTKRDLFVVLGCVTLVLLNIAAVGSSGADEPKRWSAFQTSANGASSSRCIHGIITAISSAAREAAAADGG